MNKPPAFQFYADDFLGGVTTFNMAQRGLYATLLCIQWSQGFITIDDFQALADGSAIAEPMAKRVLGKFVLGEDGNYRNARLERERQKQSEFRINRSESGKAGANKRWHSHGTAIGTAITQPMAKHSSPSPSPSTKLNKGNNAPKIVNNFVNNSDKADKAFGKLTGGKRDLAMDFEITLGQQWTNDAGKWVNRIKADYQKAWRVLAEVKNARTEKRIKTTPAQYAEQIWGEFK